MRSKKEVLEDELSDVFLKQIDENDGLLRRWIYDAMNIHAIEYHKHLSEPTTQPKTSEANLNIGCVSDQREMLITFLTHNLHDGMYFTKEVAENAVDKYLSNL